MTPPIYTSAARSDIASRIRYLARRTVRGIDSFLDSVYAEVTRHSEFPEMGIPRDDIRPGLRCCVAGRFVVFYRRLGDGIQVLRVLHGSRDVEAIMRRYDPDS